MMVHVFVCELDLPLLAGLSTAQGTVHIPPVTSYVGLPTLSYALSNGSLALSPLTPASCLACPNFSMRARHEISLILHSLIFTKIFPSRFDFLWPPGSVMLLIRLQPLP